MGVLHTILTIVQVILAVGLVVIVTLQSGKSAGLSSAIAGGDGFSAKGGSKAFDAKLLSVSSLRALMTIIGIFDQVRIFLITSTPSISGSPKSSRTISGLCDDASKMAVEPLGAVKYL